MALTETIPLELGFVAPDFQLSDTVSGKDLNLAAVQGETATVVMFICNHCPFVVHIRQELVRLANDYLSKGIGFVVICSNYVGTHPQDGPEKMKELAEQLNFPFPYLYDEKQQVAKAYQAACTPDFSVFDNNLKCVYRGQLDDSRPENDAPNNGKDIRAVLDAMIKGKPVPSVQKPSIGCNIKWKP